MKNKEAIEILKPLFEQCKGANGCLGYIEHFFTKDEEDALDLAIKALEDSSHIIEALEKLKDETMDGIVKFGIEKSIDCIKNMRRRDT